MRSKKMNDKRKKEGEKKWEKRKRESKNMRRKFEEEGFENGWKVDRKNLTSKLLPLPMMISYSSLPETLHPSAGFQHFFLCQKLTLSNSLESTFARNWNPILLRKITFSCSSEFFLSLWESLLRASLSLSFNRFYFFQPHENFLPRNFSSPWDCISKSWDVYRYPATPPTHLPTPSLRLPLFLCLSLSQTCILSLAMKTLHIFSSSSIFVTAFDSFSSPLHPLFQLYFLETSSSCDSFAR